MLEDPKQNWRLSWFNDIKMPMLTSLLLQKADISIEENMKKFAKIIKLDSLTADELFMRNATKSHYM